MTEREDARLIREIRKGNRTSFEVLLRKYEAPIFRFLLRMVGDRDTAADLFQETMMRVWKNIGKYREKGIFKAWMFRIASNCAYDHFRSSGRRKESDAVRSPDILSDYRPGPDRLAESALAGKAIQNALNKIKPELREVFLMREESGLSFREIAETTGRPLNTVLSRMRYALINLRRELEAYK